MFLIAAKKLGIAPEDCAVIEDSEAGIRAAKSGGMYAAAVGAAEHTPGADVSAESLDSLYKALCLFSEVGAG